MPEKCLSIVGSRMLHDPGDSRQYSYCRRKPKWATRTSTIGPLIFWRPFLVVTFPFYSRHLGPQFSGDFLVVTWQNNNRHNTYAVSHTQHEAPEHYVSPPPSPEARFSELGPNFRPINF